MAQLARTKSDWSALKVRQGFCEGLVWVLFEMDMQNDSRGFGKHFTWAIGVIWKQDFGKTDLTAEKNPTLAGFGKILVPTVNCELLQTGNKNSDWSTLKAQDRRLVQVLGFFFLKRASPFQRFSTGSVGYRKQITKN